MRNYAFIMTIIATIAMVSCGSGSTTTETTDSTAVQVDSLAVSANDSTVSQIPTEKVEKSETESAK